VSSKKTISINGFINDAEKLILTFVILLNPSLCYTNPKDLLKQTCIIMSVGYGMQKRLEKTISERETR